jgi:hypothetical protein
MKDPFPMQKKFVVIACTALLPAVAFVASGASAQGTKAKVEAETMRLYKGQNFTGESYVVEGLRSSLQLEMTVGSIAIFPGEKWEVCDKPRFKGSCNIVDSDMSGLGTVVIQSARPIK